MERLERQKAETRKKVKDMQKRMTAKEQEFWDRKLCDRLCSLPEIKGAKVIYGYLSLPTEAGTHEFLGRLFEAGKRVALPRVEGARIHFYQIRSFLELSKGAYGILEPMEACPPAKDRHAVMLVPGMAFTREGIRLGKGGGFYDRFLSGEPKHRTIGLAYDFQILERIPFGELDRKMDAVVTPSCVYPGANDDGLEEREETGC